MCTLQVCNKVPAPETKQVCNRICTKTTTREEQIETPSTVVSTGKGKGGDSMVMVSAGKGHRKLAGTEAMLPFLAVGHLAGKALVAKAAGAVIGAKAVAATAAVHTGKGVAMEAPQEDVQCQDVSGSSSSSNGGWVHAQTVSFLKPLFSVCTTC